eukprot:GHVO01045002.1.p1 GENE.GHVO01045002.1~~GHVO01045002.1.p1  ORF type:complete len:477 (-),score=74.22 GHVO01045002.1:72-1502(-)
MPSTTNRTPVQWGLLEETFNQYDMMDAGVVQSSDILSKHLPLVDKSDILPKDATIFPFSQRFDAEPTLSVEHYKLPQLFPEVDHWAAAAARKQTLRNLIKRREVDAHHLPNALCYTVKGTPNLTSFAIGPSECVHLAVGEQRSRIELWNLKHGMSDEEASNIPETPDAYNEDNGLESIFNEMMKDPQKDAAAKDVDTDAWYKTCTLIGHDGPVYSLKFSSDERCLLSSGGDGTINLWNVNEGRLLCPFVAHESPVWDVDFSPFDQHFASASADRTARLWAVERQQPLRIFAQHTNDVDVVKFHPNTSLIATGGSDGCVKLWDVRTGECCRSFIAHSGHSTSAIAVSQNGRFIASTSFDGDISIWDIPGGQRVDVFPGNDSRVVSMSFSHGSRLLAACGADKTVTLWNIEDLTADPLVVHPGAGDRITSANTRAMKKIGSEDVGESLVKTLALSQRIPHHVHFTPCNLLVVGAVDLY